MNVALDALAALVLVAVPASIVVAMVRDVGWRRAAWNLGLSAAAVVVAGVFAWAVFRLATVALALVG